MNPQKCFLLVQNAPCLGHCITPTGINPLRNKNDGIIAIFPPNTLGQLSGFIGMVNYYRGFWRQRSDILFPLISLTKVTAKYFHIHCKNEHLGFFKNVKKIITHDVLLKFPDTNKHYLIQTDASNYQLVWKTWRPISYHKSGGGGGNDGRGRWCEGGKR